MDDIFKRRSVRKFTCEDVPDALVEKVLAAGMAAPSAGNEQPWQFLVIKDKSVLKKIGECSPYAGAAAEAPVSVIVCGDTSLERHPGFWVQDCSAAVQNMLLEASFLGLGSVWLGIYPLTERVSALRRLFSLPENIIPFAVLPVGFPAQSLPPADRFNRTRIHVDKW